MAPYELLPVASAVELVDMPPLSKQHQKALRYYSMSVSACQFCCLWEVAEGRETERDVYCVSITGF